MVNFKKAKLTFDKLGLLISLNYTAIQFQVVHTVLTFGSVLVANTNALIGSSGVDATFATIT